MVGSGKNGKNSHGLLRVGSIRASQDFLKIRAVLKPQGQERETSGERTERSLRGGSLWLAQPRRIGDW